MNDKTKEQTRIEFEVKYPTPAGAMWNERAKCYVSTVRYAPNCPLALHNIRLETWQAAHEMYAPKWKVFISSLRESDRHIESLYTLGGCYRFVKLLQTVCDGVVPMINARRDHAAAMIDGKLYDITGEINQEGFCEATIADLIEMDEWSFDKHHMLAIGECPHCEEPLPAPLPKQEQADGQ